MAVLITKVFADKKSGTAARNYIIGKVTNCVHECTVASARNDDTAVFDKDVVVKISQSGADITA